MKTIKNKVVYEKNINELPAKVNAIIFPDNYEELKNLVKLSNEDIIPRGSGTSFTGACIPKNSSIVDFSKMNKILAIDADKKLALVESGVLLHELNEELETYNLEFPIEPLFGGIETIGGMIAKNSSGNREIKYGRMISWIDSLEVIDGKGEKKKISKSDLSEFVGQEGTTGLVLTALLRLTNKKQKSLTIFKALNLADVFVLNRKLRLKQDICSIDLLNPSISLLLGLEKKYHIFVEYDNPQGTFQGQNYEKFIKLKNKSYKKAATEGFYYISNAKLLIDSLQDFLIYLEERNIPYFAHLACGSVFPLFRPEEMEKMQESMNLARKLRGKVAYNFGIGLTKKDFLEPGEIELIRRVKNRQDPDWKINKDKLIAHKLKDKPIPLEDFSKEENAEELISKSEESIQEPFEKKESPSGEIELSSPAKKKELSAEEKEKIKKIASGFFGGKND